MSYWMVPRSLLKPDETDLRRRVADYRMPFVFAVSQEVFLKSPNGASVVCTHRELKRGVVVCILYGASLPVVPRKRHGRMLLERGMHMFNAS
jgi:hypothetical protein